MNCPKCNYTLPGENINIQANIGKCDSCGNVFSVSETINSTINNAFNINNPPSGTWFRRDYNEVIIGASTRSAIAFFLVPFMLIWSGGSLGGIYGTQIINGEFEVTSSLFGIPFLLGSLFFWGITVMAIWGKVEITMDRQGGNVFTGVGKIGLTKSFNWKHVSRVKEAPSKIGYPGSHGGKLVLDGADRISFGTGLNENRRYYVMSALQKILLNVRLGKNLV